MAIFDPLPPTLSSYMLDIKETRHLSGDLSRVKVKLKLYFDINKYLLSCYFTRYLLFLLKKMNRNLCNWRDKIKIQCNLIKGFWSYCIGCTTIDAMLVCTIGGKTGKTVILPGFYKIERGSAPPCYRGLIWLGRVCHAGGAPAWMYCKCTL